MKKDLILEAKIVTCPVLNQTVFSPSVNLNDFKMFGQTARWMFR